MFKTGLPARTTGDTPASSFRSEFDRLIERFFGEPGRGLQASAGSWLPPLDIHEDGDGLSVRLELPGLSTEDVRLEVVGGNLVISGEKQVSDRRASGNCHYSERRFGAFRRTVPLSERIDAARITAEFDRGVLTVRLPLNEQVRPRRIQVSAG